MNNKYMVCGIFFFLPKAGAIEKTTPDELVLYWKVLYFDCWYYVQMANVDNIMLFKADEVRARWSPVPYVVHYFWSGPILVHYVGNREPFWTRTNRHRALTWTPHLEDSEKAEMGGRRSGTWHTKDTHLSSLFSNVNPTAHPDWLVNYWWFQSGYIPSSSIHRSFSLLSRG